MTFTTTLFKLLESASIIAIDHYEIDDDMLRFYDEVGQPTRAEFDLHGYPFINLYDQEVVVDSDGQCNATTTDGETETFIFRVSRPITEGDLL